MHLFDYMAVHNLSDEEVAKRIGRSRVTVSRIRRRVIRRPDWGTVERIKAMTDGAVTADDFLETDQ